MLFCLLDCCRMGILLEVQGRSSQHSSSLAPKRDCSLKRANLQDQGFFNQHTRLSASRIIYIKAECRVHSRVVPALL